MNGSVSRISQVFTLILVIAGNLALLVLVAIAIFMLGNQVLAAEPAVSNSGYSYAARSTIEGHALTGLKGTVGINQAAGDNNLQLNARALAVTREGVALSRVVGMQRTSYLPPAEGDAISRIDGAFANATGLISINQASGSSNAQANAVAVSLGIQGDAIADTHLKSEVSGQSVYAPTSNSALYREASVTANTFRGASGLVQLNQAAGSGNATGNSFALSISLTPDTGQ